MPFTADEFFGVFAAYNQAVWPAYVVAYALAAMTLVLIVLRPTEGARAALGLLAVMWAWNAAAYFLLFFSRINIAAYGFGALYLVQAVLLARAMTMTADAPPRGWTVARIFGAILIVYSMAIYEQLGVWFGHGWPRGPLFGIAPCPTTIFTIGLLMLTVRNPPAALMIVPLIWSAIGATAAILFGVPEDLGLLAAGLIGVVWLLSSARRRAA